MKKFARSKPTRRSGCVIVAVFLCTCSTILAGILNGKSLHTASEEAPRPTVALTIEIPSTMTKAPAMNTLRPAATAVHAETKTPKPSASPQLRITQTITPIKADLQTKAPTRMPAVLAATNTLPPVPLTWTPEPHQGNCDPSYPDFCIPPPPPDLDCKDVRPHKNFTVLPPDPHGFDRDGNGRGCEN